MFVRLSIPLTCAIKICLPELPHADVDGKLQIAGERICFHALSYLSLFPPYHLRCCSSFLLCHISFLRE